MAKPTISVIVPVYNTEEYLDSCINSIIGQTYKQLEIILIDDGSTDNSGLLCDKWSNADSRIRVIHKTNGGLSSSRNAGIDISTGEYLGFVDSDDTISLNMYELLFNSIERNNCEISCCGIERIYMTNKRKRMFKRAPRDYIIENSNVLKEILLEKYTGSEVCNKLFKRELFDSIRFPLNTISEDIATTYKLFGLAKRACIIPEVGYNYFQRPISITSSPLTKKNLSIIASCKDIEEYVRYNHKQILPVAEAHSTRMYKLLMILLHKKGSNEEVKNTITSYFSNINPSFIFNKHLSLKDKLFILLIKCKVYPKLLKIYLIFNTTSK